MCTNRALTDLYAFSARFIQLLNRKLAYVCIADYYKSEQNVLFCLTLIIEEFYKLKYCSTVVYMVPRA